MNCISRFLCKILSDSRRLHFQLEFDSVLRAKYAKKHEIKQTPRNTLFVISKNLKMRPHVVKNNRKLLGNITNGTQSSSSPSKFMWLPNFPYRCPLRSSISSLTFFISDFKSDISSSVLCFAASKHVCNELHLNYVRTRGRLCKSTSVVSLFW